jgi:hypothetical protein
VQRVQLCRHISICPGATKRYWRAFGMSTSTECYPSLVTSTCQHRLLGSIAIEAIDVLSCSFYVNSDHISNCKLSIKNIGDAKSMFPWLRSSGWTDFSVQYGEHPVKTNDSHNIFIMSLSYDILRNSSCCSRCRWPLR